jgi:hypothetical protein
MELCRGIGITSADVENAKMLIMLLSVNITVWSRIVTAYLGQLLTSGSVALLRLLLIVVFAVSL